MPATALGAASPPADGVVAAVGSEVIALTTLRAYREAYAPAQPAAIALEQLIDDRLLAAQARRYGLAPTDAELASEGKAHPTPAGFTAEEWGRLLGDHKLARRFLDFRFGDFVAIGREELRAYYDAHRADMTGGFKANEDRVRALLLPAARAAREAAFKAELRQREAVAMNAELLAGE